MGSCGTKHVIYFSASVNHMRVEQFGRASAIEANPIYSCYTTRTMAARIETKAAE